MKGRIQLPWMDKIRSMYEKRFSNKKILNELFKYGLDEEKRINKEFKQMAEALQKEKMEE